MTIAYDGPLDIPQCYGSNLRFETLVPDIGLVHRIVETNHGMQSWALCMAVVDGKIIGDPTACTYGERADVPAAAIDPTTWGSVKATFGK